MNEQLIPAYVNLIESLLTCSSGEENQILNQSRELLDQGLVLTMLAMSANFTTEGQEEQAQFLLRWAERVAGMIGVNLSQFPQLESLTSLAQQVDSRVAQLMEWIDQPTWTDSQAFLQQHPQLLDQETDTILVQMIQFAEEGKSQQRSLQVYRELLQRCRELGIEQGFSEKLKEIRAEGIESAKMGLLPELMELVDDPEMAGVLEEVLTGLLLDNEADLDSPEEDLDEFLSRHSDLQQRVDAMIRQKTIQQAIEQARAEFPPEMIELLGDPEMARLIHDILGDFQKSGTQPHDPDELERFLRSRPELMERLAEVAVGVPGLENRLNAENSSESTSQPDAGGEDKNEGMREKRGF